MNDIVTILLMEVAFYFVLAGAICPRALPNWFEAIEYPTNLMP